MAKGKRFISQEYSTEKGGRNIKEGTRKSRAATIFAATFFSFAILIGVSLITFTIIFFFSDVKGTSMMKTLNAYGKDTDSVVVNRYVKPKRGDIIVVKHYDANGKFKEYHIKRLLALGGESIYFSDENSYYEVQVGKKGEYPYTVYDNNHEKFKKLNVNNDGNPNVKSQYSRYHNDYYAYQESGGILQPSMRNDETYRDMDRVAYNNPGFRDKYEKDGQMIPFMQWNEDMNRNELQLPDNYMFYMGDNRGGSGKASDIDKMSVDCTYFGPQPYSHIVGVVVEVVPDNKSAPRWFFDKIIWVITFKWI